MPTTSRQHHGIQSVHRYNDVCEGYLQVNIRVVCENASKRSLNQSGLHGNHLIWHTDTLYFLRAAAAQADL